MRTWEQQRLRYRCKEKVGALIILMLLGSTMYIYLNPLERESEGGFQDFHYHLQQSEYGGYEKHDPKQFKETDKTNELLDIHNFEYLTNVPSPLSWCASPSNQTRTLLIMVFSLRRNTANRDLIRKSWGSLRRITQWSLKLVFILGGKSNRRLESDQLYENTLNKEIEQESDIVMGNFEEEYANRKIRTHLMAYKWALTYCQDAVFILKTTDSTFVDTFQITEMLSYTAPMETGLICGLRKATVNFQKVGSKTKRITPQHCRPETMILSMEVVEQLYLANGWLDSTQATLSYSITGETGNKLISFSKAVSSLDDQIFLTGYVVNELGIGVRNMEHKVLFEPSQAFDWAHNGKIGRDQRLPWIFVFLPYSVDFYLETGLSDLWGKILNVSSLVYEFELSSAVTIPEAVRQNFKTAGRRLNFF